MKIKEESENEPRQNSNLLIAVVSFLLLASIGLSVIGLLNGKKSITEDENIADEHQKIVKEEEEESLTDMFQKKFSEGSSISKDYPNDPFNEICAPARGGNAPSTSSFTVCQP